VLFAEEPREPIDTSADNQPDEAGGIGWPTVSLDLIHPVRWDNCTKSSVLAVELAGSFHLSVCRRLRTSVGDQRVYSRGLQAYFSSSVFARTFFGYIPERLTFATHKDVRYPVISPIRRYA